ncbi:MAG: discoidin domain-containing protein [Magnetococcales bacterium]|nr:discoidin domain-containing protein [Magnetococcales bacterium]
MAAYRYWRIEVTASTSGSDQLVSLYELELRALPGGADQCQNGVAAASHNDSTAYRLFDDNPSSYWSNGGPSAPSWLHYDFGSGASISVGEIRMLPRSQWMSPKDFTLSGSLDGNSWQAIATWSGVTDWLGGVEKLFIPPPPPQPVVRAQAVLPFALALARECRQSHDNGLFAQDALGQRWAFAVSVSAEQFWWLSLAEMWRHAASQQGWSNGLLQGCACRYQLLLEASYRAFWSRQVGQRLQQTLHDAVQAEHIGLWSLLQRLQQVCTQPMAATWRREIGQQQPYLLQEKNSLWHSRLWRWNLSATPSAILRQPPALTISAEPLPHAAAPLALQAASIRYHAAQGVWRSELRLATAEVYRSLALEDRFVLSVAGESFAFLVNGKRLQRSHPHGESWILYGVSPLVAHDFPRARRSNQSWNLPCSARQVVEELLATSVDWSLPDWPLPPGLLQARDETPLQLARRLAADVGGVVQSQADGSIQLRPQFAVAVASWPQLQPAHCLTDQEDVIAIDTLQQVQEQVDQVVVHNQAASRAAATDFRLSLQWQQRQDGDDPTQRLVVPGETAHVLLNPAHLLPGLQLVSSTGVALQTSEWVVVQESEDLLFVAGNLAHLEQPAERIDTFVWLGRSLGEPVLQADGRTVWVPQSGTAVLRVTVTRSARSFPLTIPASLAEQEPCPVLVSASSDRWSPGTLAVTLERESVRYPHREIAAPLLTNANALYCRARQELERGSGLQQLAMTILFRPGLAAGQVIEVQDEGLGATFRAMIEEVHHELTPKESLSHLTVWRA